MEFEQYKTDRELITKEVHTKKIFDGYMNDLQILMEATNNECD